MTSESTTPSHSPSEKKRLRIKTFPAGTWRVAWLGDVGLHIADRNYSQLSYAITLCDPATGKYFDVALPVGMMALTPIGSTWLDGERQDDDWQESKVFKVVTAKTKAVKAGIADDSDTHGTLYLLPFNQYKGHAKHTSSWLLRCETDQGLVLIPALELVRFYFGSSSSLLMRMFSQPFDGRKLWTDVKRDEASGAVHITLEDGLSGASAADIARIALCAEAETVALNVWRSLLAGRLSNEPAYPKLRLPFAGASIMRARGITLADGLQADRFVVHELLQCSHPFPFSVLTYSSETPRPRQQSEATKSGHVSPAQAPTKVMATKLAGSMSIDDVEPRRVAQPTQLKIQSDAKFADLTRKRVARVSPPNPAVLQIVGGQVAYEGAVGEGMSTATPRRAEVTSQESEPNAKPIKTPLYCPVGVWKPYFELLERFAALSSRIEVAFVPLGARQVHAHLSMLPTLVDEDGVCAPEALGEDGAVAQHFNGQRAVSIAWFRFSGRHAYLVSVEPRSTDTTWRAALFSNDRSTPMDHTTLIGSIAALITGVPAHADVKWVPFLPIHHARGEIELAMNIYDALASG